MSEDLVRAIVVIHVAGVDGFCVGCRWWWARLTPYPCSQVEWATRRQARVATWRFLDGRS